MHQKLAFTCLIIITQTLLEGIDPLEILDPKRDAKETAIKKKGEALYYTFVDRVLKSLSKVRSNSLFRSFHHKKKKKVLSDCACAHHLQQILFQGINKKKEEKR